MARGWLFSAQEQQNWEMRRWWLHPVAVVSESRLSDLSRRHAITTTVRRRWERMTRPGNAAKKGEVPVRKYMLEALLEVLYKQHCFGTCPALTQKDYCTSGT